MKRIFTLFFLAALLVPAPSLAFNYNFIISDKELEDSSSMSLQDIKDFLADHNSFLQYYADFYPEGGAFMEAPEIIWRASQQFSINPKFLLALLEKEQSLISFQKPVMKRLDWAMGYAVCDKCPLSHPLIVQFKGFAKQVYGAAEKIRNDYMADLEKYGKITNGFGPGITKKVDKKYKITPVNNATAVLYTYTPHIAGNQSFYVLWKNWFSNIKYPDGSLLQDIKSHGVYLIDNGKKRPFLSEPAFTSRFHEDQIVEATPSFLARYPDGEPIEFINYSLLRDENKNIYLLADDKLRPFDSIKTVRALGLDADDAKNTTTDKLGQFDLGEPITAASSYPTGALLQIKSTGGVYWINGGIKYPILDKSIIKTVFSNEKLVKTDESQLQKFNLGEPVKFKNGTLVKSKNNSTIYFISDDKLRPIPSEEVFLAYNWKWENVVATTDKILALYETGAPITLEGDDASPPEIDDGSTQTGGEANDTSLSISTNNQP
ncbi:MAG: hypothetical protein V1661_00350 [bacterium]